MKYVLIGLLFIVATTFLGIKEKDVISIIEYLEFKLETQEEIESASPRPTPVTLGVNSESIKAWKINKEIAQVVRVVDGDTIRVSIDNEEYPVRLIGIDTPETVKPNSPIECYGTEASNKLKELLIEKTVFLEKDVNNTDRYARLLRYVYIVPETATFSSEVSFINQVMVREGYAQASAYPPDIKYQAQLDAAELEAQGQKAGLWGEVCQEL